LIAVEGRVGRKALKDIGTMPQTGGLLITLNFLASYLFVANAIGPVHAATGVSAPGHETNSNAGVAILRELGLDASLWDSVQNRTPLTADDREPFYQLLAAMETLDTRELIRRAPRTLGQTASSVVPLFNEPDRQFGQLVVLEGTARRAVKIYVGTAHGSNGGRENPSSARDAVERAGIAFYYELDMITADSQNHPIVFCVRRLPPGFPQGENITEPVRAVGFFYKVWAYGARSGAQRRAGMPGATSRQWELAPLVIGPGVQWLVTAPPKGRDYAGMIAGVLFALAMAGIWLAVWNERRGARRFDERAGAMHEHGNATDLFDPIEIQTDSNAPGDGSSLK
jgi:hypothetical protein